MRALRELFHLFRSEVRQPRGARGKLPESQRANGKRVCSTSVSRAHAQTRDCLRVTTAGYASTQQATRRGEKGESARLTL